MGVIGHRLALAEDKEWFRVGEAARFIGVHYNTLREWIDDYKIPAQRTLGNQRRLSRSTLMLIGASMNKVF